MIFVGLRFMIFVGLWFMIFVGLWLMIICRSMVYYICKSMVYDICRSIAYDICRIESLQLRMSGADTPEGSLVSSGQDAVVKYWNINRWVCHWTAYVVCELRNNPEQNIMVCVSLPNERNYWLKFMMSTKWWVPKYVKGILLGWGRRYRLYSYR